MQTATAIPSAATQAHWGKKPPLDLTFPTLETINSKPDIAQWLAELKAAPELLRELMAAANIGKTEQFPPLATVTKTHVDTAAAAHYLNRRPQTLRGWHCHGDFIDGLRPLVINSRLAWPVAGIKKVMGV